jgi:hypothetical protein
MTAFAIVLFLVALVGSIAIAKRIADEERWEERAEKARIDHEVRRSERRLRNLTSHAFWSMLEATRRQTGDPD